jgi:hypothetical protein
MWSLNGAGLARYDASRYFSEYINANLGQTFGFVFTRGISSGWDLFTGTVGSNIAIFLSAGLAGIIAATILFLTTIFGAVAVSAVLVLIGFIIAIIFFLIRLLFVLAKAYLLLLIFLIFGPLIILWNTIIGKGIWDGWLRGVTANLLVFPGVGIVIFLTDVLINQVMEAGDKIWGPPYIGRQHIVIQGLIGIGAIFLLPQIPDIINQLLGVKMPEGKLPEVGKRFEPIGTTTVKELEGAAQQSAIFRKRPGWWPEGLPWPKNPER